MQDESEEEGARHLWKIAEEILDPGIASQSPALIAAARSADSTAH